MPIQPLNQSLLTQIANPQVPDIFGAFQRGQLAPLVLRSQQQKVQMNDQNMAGEAQRQQDVSQQMASRAQQMDIAKSTEDRTAKTFEQSNRMLELQNITADVIALASMEPGQRGPYIQRMLQKYKDNPDITNDLQRWAKLPLKDQETELFEFIGQAKELLRVPGQTGKPFTEAGKARADAAQGYLSPEEADALVAQETGNKFANKIDLARAASAGDPEAQRVLDKLTKMEKDAAYNSALSTAQAKVDTMVKVSDFKGVAKAVVEGREDFNKLKNTFGLTVIEAIRKEILKLDPKFNFVSPNVRLNALNKTYQEQVAKRGSMGSFVKNIHSQIDEITTLMNDMIHRSGIRAANVPYRAVLTKFKGSGKEKAYEALMKEISAEIDKLSQNATGSVAQLASDNLKHWESIHDVNLPASEIFLILDETRQLANMRLQSVDDEIQETADLLRDIRDTSPRPKRSEGVPPGVTLMRGGGEVQYNPQTKQYVQEYQGQWYDLTTHKPVQ